MPRTRSFGVCLLAGLLLIVALVCGLVVAHQREAKLCWQGRPLKYWFNQLGGREIMRSPSGAVGRYGCWLETPEASSNAVRGIGTNALGFYLSKLRRRPGARETQIAMAARRVGFEDFMFRIRGVDSERGQAATALILLKPLPAEVVSELVILSTNVDRDIAAAAHWVLDSKSRSPSVDAELFKIPISPDFE